MKTRQIVILILMVTVLAQAACTTIPAPSTVPAPTVAATTSTAGITATAADIESSCPTPTAETKLLTNAEEGYCLLYPAEYSTAIPKYIVINPISAPGDIPGDAWLYVQVQDAAGKTAAQIVEEQVAALGEGFNITMIDVEMDGEQAVVVDGLPGFDSNRQVFVVHNRRLYNLFFMPWFPNATDPTPLENLYTMVMDMLHFLPEE